MDFTLEQAKAFCAVVECGGYTKAAEELRKTHSSLIYLVKNLEEQSGLQLFDRSGYRNELTEAGKKFFLKCRELLQKADEIKQFSGGLQRGWEPNIKIIYDGILPVHHFLDLYRKFKSEKIPTVVQTYAAFLQDVEDTYDHLEADMMISILPLHRVDLKAFYLKSFSSYLVAHKDHPLHQRKGRWTLDELSQYDFLTIRGSSNPLHLNTAELEKSASFFLSDFSMKKEAILKKTGFGWLPEHLIESELQQKRLIPIRWERSSRHEIQPILYVHPQKISGLATSTIVNWFRSLEAGT